MLGHRVDGHACAISGEMGLKLLVLAAAGALGTLARFGLSMFVQRQADSTFPYGTLGVNMLGCLLFGVLWGLGEHRAFLSHETRALVLVGFMGAFTTFSSFVFDSYRLGFLEGAWGLAALNVSAQNLFGFAAVALGVVLARWVA